MRPGQPRKAGATHVAMHDPRLEAKLIVTRAPGARHASEDALGPRATDILQWSCRGKLVQRQICSSRRMSEKMRAYR
jgi:hypothetical protein